jgi:hypothetical protein
VTGSEATLNGELNPGASSEAVHYHFAYSAGAGCGESGLSAPQPPGEAEGNKVKVSTLASGLEPNREYSFCLVAANPLEETELATGNQLKFTTLAVAPTIASESASGVTPTEARIEGLVNANNESSECHIQYGEATVSEHEEECEPATLEGFGEQSVGKTIAGLNPGTTYHVALVATNAAGTTVGADQTFTTAPPTPPTATTVGASSLTSSSATVTGTIDPDGLDTTWEVQAGAEAGAYYPVASGSIAGTEGATALSVELTGLPAGTTLHYRFVATNQDGTSYGADRPLTTAGLPASVVSPPAPILGFPGFFTALNEKAAKEAAEEARQGTSAGGGFGSSKPLTNKQKLAKALKQCKKEKAKSKRKACERQARKRYGAKKASNGRGAK